MFRRIIQTTTRALNKYAKPVVQVGTRRAIHDGRSAIAIHATITNYIANASPRLTLALRRYEVTHARKDHKSDDIKTTQEKQSDSSVTTPDTKAVGSLTSVVDQRLSTVVFGHHPCPDGIAAMVCLAEKFGMQKAAYHGLNHAKLDDMRENIFSAIGSQPANIIFADIVPPFSILKEVLEKTTCTVTLLDHHATAKLEIDAKAEFLRPFINSPSPRLHVDLDLKRSGAGIAYDYVHGKKDRPVYISLVQAIDLLTATANTDVIKQFDTKQINFDSKSQEILRSLSSLSRNDQIKSYIEFYLFAAIFDLQMKQFFKDNNNQMNNALMTSVKTYFDLIEKEGLASLLTTTFPDAKGTNRTIETIFREQLEYQEKAIANAIVIPSLINDEMDVLFIEADVQTGRTFEPLIAEKLASLRRPTIAMIANTSHISDNNWVALRAADNTLNLYDIASRYKANNLAANAGGHARASALQLSRAQISTFLNLAAHYKRQACSGLSHFSVFTPALSTPLLHPVRSNNESKSKYSN